MDCAADDALRRERLQRAKSSNLERKSSCDGGLEGAASDAAGSGGVAGAEAASSAASSSADAAPSAMAAPSSPPRASESVPAKPRLSLFGRLSVRANATKEEELGV